MVEESKRLEYFFFKTQSRSIDSFSPKDTNIKQFIYDKQEPLYISICACICLYNTIF